MPLEKAPEGSPGFSRNIKEMVEHGHPQKQAVAAAYSAARGDADTYVSKLDAAMAKCDSLGKRLDGLDRRDSQRRMG